MLITVENEKIDLDLKKNEREFKLFSFQLLKGTKCLFEFLLFL